jgi:hypothetical protein
MSERQPVHSILVRIPWDLYKVIDKAAFYSRKPRNQIICDALLSCKSNIKEKYLKKSTKKVDE